jgi:hypothetical protein
MTDQQTERFVAALDARRVEPRPEFVAELGQRFREEAGSSAVSAIVWTDEPRKPVGTNLVVDFEQQPDESDALSDRTRWFSVGIAVAATILVLVGVVVVADRDIEPDAPSSPSVTEPPPEPGPTTTVPEAPSPLIDMRSRLTNNANSEMFVVRASAESYWRLSTLARFDGVSWGLPESTLSRADGGELSTVGGGDELGQEIRIVNLDGPLVPAAADPTNVSPSEGLRWNADSSTLVKVDGDFVAGDVYEIVSVLPHFEVEDLQAATALDAGDPIYLELPDDFPRRVDELARDVTAGSTTPYETALALQNWFRDPSEWSYSLDVQAGHSNSAMESFLSERVGYSEQFAGTYAAMMRSLGIPTRVALGFTPGNALEFTPGNALGDQSYSVLGKHAHAWPEVWFDGLGWVSFEPTPGHGARQEPRTTRPL